MKTIAKRNVGINEMIKATSIFVGFVSFVFWLLFLFSFILVLGSTGPSGYIFNFGISIIMNHTIWGVASVIIAIYFMREVKRMETKK